MTSLILLVNIPSPYTVRKKSEGAHLRLSAVDLLHTDHLPKLQLTGSFDSEHVYYYYYCIY